MIIYLTSDPGGAWDIDGKTTPKPFKKDNGFLSNITADLLTLSPNVNNRTCLIVAASPDDYAHNDIYRDVISISFMEANLPMERIDICDNRRPEYVHKLSEYDLIYLCGGHLPVQAKFFNAINLKKEIADYKGIVLALSAGSMNSAKTVYFLPEFEEDLSVPSNERFYEGLGLTEYQIIPHFQWFKNVELCGKNIIHDIACEDSFGQEFIALCDGSYFRIEKAQNNSTCELYGEAYGIADGEIWRI